MKRLVTIVAAVAIAVSAGACSDDPGGNDGGIDAAADVGVDADTEADGTDDPDVVRDTSASDTDRDQSDINTNWDLGTADGDTSDDAFALERVVPSSGPTAGGNRVRIAGTNLGSDMRVYFGSREVDVRFSSGSLVGIAPEAPSPGKVTVKVIDEEDDRTRSIEDGYEYIADVEVDSITPRRVPTEGGVMVDIRGSGFTDPISVAVGGTSALQVERVDRTLLRAIVPAGDRGPADVRLTTPHESDIVEDGIDYIEPLEIESVSPAAGATAGGDEVTIEVSGLGDEAAVYFGQREAEVRGLDPRKGEIVVDTPPHSAGLVDVSVESGGDAALRPAGFYYSDDAGPSLASVRPDFGSTAGGTEVTLIGRGLDVADPSVSFGGTEANVLQTDPTRIRVETKARSAGVVDVVVASSGSEIARLADGFEYRTGFEIDSVTPETGPTDGGTSVVVEGSGFDAAERLEFGGLPAEFDVKSDDRIDVETPPHIAGAVDVAVSGNEIEAVDEEAFTYTTDLDIWGFQPVRGAIAGGTYVEIRGSGFTGRIEAAFDDTAAPEVRRIDRNNLYVYTPAHAPGETELTVSTEEDEATGPYPYEFFDPSSRFGGASGGEVEGAVNVTVLAQGAGPIPKAFVMLSTRADTPHSGITDQNGQVTLSGPEVNGPQTVTATAKGFSSTTVKSVDAENITVFLRKMNPENGGGGGGGGGPPSGTIEGKVTTPPKMSNPDKQKTYDMAVVGTTKKEISSRKMAPGEGSVVVGGGQYSITSRIGDVAVVALCGVYDEEADDFEPKYMGVRRYLNVSDGGTYEADIECDIPLDQSLDVKIQNPIFAPDGPDTNRAQVYWDFGFEGVFQSPTTARGMGELLTVENQPEPDDELRGVTFSVVGGSFTGNGSPSSQTQLHDIEEVSTTAVLPPLVDVPEPVDPTAGGKMEGREIRFQTAGPHYPDLYSIYLLNQKGRPFWQYFMDGDSRTIELPEFPDFSFLPAEDRPEPMANGQAFVLIIGIDARQAAFDDFTYQDLSYSAWRGYSITRWGFQMP